jgi:hypothetical protein
MSSVILPQTNATLIDQDFAKPAKLTISIRPLAQWENPYVRTGTAFKLLVPLLNAKKYLISLNVN